VPEQLNDLTHFRKAHYALEDLPDTIAFPKHPGREAEALVALSHATIDDIAFAIIAAEQESTAAYRRSSALQRLYKLAREAGGAGVDFAVETALKQERS
jgi:hypothetical protein